MFQVSRAGNVLIAVGMIGTIAFGIWLPWTSTRSGTAGSSPPSSSGSAAAIGGRVGKVYNVARDRARALLEEGRDEPSPELNAILRSAARGDPPHRPWSW